MIIRRKIEHGYTTMPRAALEDARLSYEARGLLGYLLAKPNDWRVHVTDLCKAAGPKACGRERIYRILDELKAAGYIAFGQARGADGRKLPGEYTVTDEPGSIPTVESPQSEKPDAAQPDAAQPDAGQPRAANQDAYKELSSTNAEKDLTTTPAIAGGGNAPTPPPAETPDDDASPDTFDPDAPVEGQRATFAALCSAAGWLPKDLTQANRAALAKLAARILEDPADDRPTVEDLAAIYCAELAELSARVRRSVRKLTVEQFRQAIGAWIAARRKAAQEREFRAAVEARVMAAPEPRHPKANPEAVRRWEVVATVLRHSMSPATWEHWLAAARPTELAEDVLTVEVPTRQHAEFITGRLIEPLKRGVAMAELADMRLVVDDEARGLAA